MKRNLLIGAIALTVGSLLAADASPKDEVIAAAKQLGEKSSYSWKTTIVVPESAQFKPGPQEGKVEKDGVTEFKMSFGDNTTEAYLKGGQAAVTDPDGGWQSLDELNNAEGPGRFLAALFRNFKAPATQAADIATDTKQLKQDGDVIAGDLTTDGAKALLTFRRRAAGGDGPTVTDPKGSAKFWIKDGLLAKYEFKVTGKVDFGGNEVDVDRTTTIEIKDVGTTKVQVPDAARKKLEPASAPAPSKPAN